MPVPEDSTVTLRFTGLLVFCFKKQPKCCQIGIHSKSDDHELRIRLVKKESGLEIGSEEALTISHGFLRDVSDLWLGVEGSPSPKQKTAMPFIAGNPDQPLADPQDFRQVMDLEGEHFYNHPMKLKKGVLKPSLFVAQGLFYSATLSPRSYWAVPVSPNGGGHQHTHEVAGPAAAGKSLGRVAEYVGVNIYLDHPNQTIVLRVGRKGPELWRLKREADRAYEITVDNGPTTGAPAGSHFEQYYDAFELAPSEPKILLETEGVTTRNISGVCDVIQLSKSNGLGGGG